MPYKLHREVDLRGVPAKCHLAHPHGHSVIGDKFTGALPAHTKIRRHHVQFYAVSIPLFFLKVGAWLRSSDT